MKLEDQVCSLELAKRLKELGVRQESLFYWWKQGTSDVYKILALWDENIIHIDKQIASAFTVAELGWMLPGIVKKNRRKYYLSLLRNTWNGKTINSWGMSYKSFWDRAYEDIFYSVCEGTEADARAKMLIYLLEEGLCQAPKE